MNQKILIIDDEDVTRLSLQRVLEKEGFRVESANNARDAFPICTSFQPNIILCDIIMPEMNGYEFLEKIRQDIRFSHIPFLFLSSKDEINDIREGMNRGADDYLVKPFDKQDLLNAIKTRSGRLKQIIEHRHRADSKKNQILLIDDDPFHHVIYKATLKNIKPQYKYLTFVDAQKAIDYLEGFPQDIYCIFLDLIMPGISGIDFLQQMAELLQSYAIIVYVLSNEITLTDRDLLKTFPCVKGIIEKPLTKEKLYTVEQSLSQ